MKIGIKKTVDVEAKVLDMCAKTSDMCSITLLDQDGQKICDHDGYVPGFFPGDHGGDYIQFKIDLETGQILNWKKPHEQDIQKFVNKCNGMEEDE